MPASGDHDLLFGVTAMQLRFVTQEQLVAATAALDGAQPGGLRAKLCELKLLNPAEAEAVAAVVAQRLARFGDDPRTTLDSVGAAEAALLSGTTPKTDRHSPAPTHADRFVTRSPKVWTYEPGGQRFNVLRLHQKGGLGRLMVALDTELNREIALKEILPNFADHEENRRRFIREAEITGALEHPGIVPVYSLGEFPDGRPYYAMRLIRGVDMLAAINDFHAKPATLAEREFELRQLLGRFVDVCHAVDYAHNRGVIHRDLKPSNIMFGDYGETLVVDWGLARTTADAAASSDLQVQPVTPSERAASSATQAGRLVGTVAYMSPEQAAGRLDLVGPSSDIYGLGATLYHLLAGKPPFEGDAEDLAFQVEQGRFRSPREVVADVPKPLAAICLKAMARQQKDRYPKASDLALDVERYLADEPTTAYAEPALVRGWRWVRHHQALVMTSMAAILIASAALAAGVVLLGAANKRERAAREAADRNFVAAEEARGRAERNFRLAQDAVRQYFVRVSEDTLLNQPGMQPLRDSLLRQALVYFNQFLKERGDDPLVRREVAEAQFNVGRIAETVDSPAAALPHYLEAAKLEENLQKDPKLPDAGRDALRQQHGQTLNAIGRVMQKLQRTDDARAYYREAADLREKLAAAKPGDAERARALASSVMNLGIVEQASGNLPAALALLERAQTLRLAQSDGKSEQSPAMWRDLGSGYFNIATVLLAQGDAEGAQAKLVAAVDAFKRLAELDPKDLESRRRMANCLRMLADAKSASSDDEEALASYREARTALAELVLRNPDVPEYAVDLAGVEMNLAVALRSSDDLPGAIAEMSAASEALRRVAGLLSASPRNRRDFGVALRAEGQMLAELDRREEARKRLEESKEVLSKLVREFPGDAANSTELGITVDALRELDAI